MHVLLALAEPTTAEIIAYIVAALGGGEGLRRLVVWGRKVIGAAAAIADGALKIEKLAADIGEVQEGIKAFDSVHGRLIYLEAQAEAAQLAAGLAKIGWDSQGQCVYVCLEWQALTHLGIEDARGHGWLESIHPEDRPRVRLQWEEFLKGVRRRLSIEDYRVQRPDGSIVRCRLRAGRGYSRNREASAIVGLTYPVAEPPAGVKP